MLCAAVCCACLEQQKTTTDGMKSLRGSVFWMAPEVLTGKGYGELFVEV